NSSEIAKLTHAVNQQTNVVTTTMTAILKQFQATPPPAPVKAVEETCVTCGAAVNYNQGNLGYRPPGLANQIRPPGFAQPNVKNNPNQFGPPQGFNRRNEQSYQASAPQNQNVYLNELEKVRRINEASMKAMQTQIDMVKNKLRNEMKGSIQTSLSNQTNEIKNMMAILLQINTASTSGSGSLPSNTVANPKGELKAITTRIGLVIDGPTVPTHSQSINPEEDEHVEETFTDPDLAEDVFIPVGKFTFPADFVIVDYESDPRVPLILGRPFLRSARALIDVHGKEMILRDGDERLTLNMRLDTSSYSNQPQKESINLMFSTIQILTKDLHPPLHDNPLSGSTTYPLLEEFADELPPEYDDNLQFDIESDLKEIEFLLYQDKDSSLKDSIDQKNLESDAKNIYNDPFDSKGEKIKESKLLIDELDLPCDFHPPPEYDSFIFQDFSRVDALPSTNNEDKIFNPGILIQEKPVEIITRVVQDKKLAISNASLVFKDFDPPF
nr:reverse transcriptase domain-containing protein [Tanacetum cinerariifolium]